MAPRIIFGTASFGMDHTDFQDEKSVTKVLETLKELGIDNLDTAARYPPLNPGRTEELIGLTRAISGGFTIDTKVFTATDTDDGSGDLTMESVEKSITASLGRMNRTNVNILYAHRPDPATALEDQIQSLNEQVTKGRCKAWGVSNFPPALLEKVLQLCELNGWQKPSVYQGHYSIVTRGMETTLLPIIRAHNMRYHAFRVLEAGFLTSSCLNNDYANTKLDGNIPLEEAIKGLYEAKAMHSTMKKFGAQVKTHGLTPIEVAIRWLTHHSALRDQDGIILGAHTTSQIVDSVGMVKKGPLPEELLQIVDDVWDALKESRANII